MSYKVGVFGSAVDESEVAQEKAQKLGKALGQHGCIVMTGACPGMPFEVANAARQNGSKIWGFSPAADAAGQEELVADQDIAMYDKLIYVPASFVRENDVLVCRKYRNVLSTSTCDAGLIVSGRWGTLNEFTNLYDMGKVIGVLTGTGGTADELKRLSKIINKESKAEVIFDDAPEKLLERMLKILDNRK